MVVCKKTAKSGFEPLYDKIKPVPSAVWVPPLFPSNVQQKNHHFWWL